MKQPCHSKKSNIKKQKRKLQENPLKASNPGYSSGNFGSNFFFVSIKSFPFAFAVAELEHDRHNWLDYTFHRSLRDPSTWLVDVTQFIY